MKRGRLALTVIAGLAVFLVVLFFYLPASWFRSQLPPGVACGDIGGSVWAGECIGLAVGDARIGDATWNLAALSALRGRLVGDVDLRGALAQVRADLDLSTTGSGELRNVTGQFPLDHAFIAQFPADRRGRLALDVKKAVIADRAIRQLEGTVELRDFQQIAPTAMDLGSYRVTFDGVAQPDGKVLGNLADTGGPLRVEGTLTLVPPNRWEVHGYVTGRTADAERMLRQALPYASPDTSGRTQIDLEGDY
ncbi:MAG TPA: type II secretion system protein N [Steroidobacteraceae bacterium]|nr:type II secretion system protein N [Steroidobacteraceae bacterium]